MPDHQATRPGSRILKAFTGRFGRRIKFAETALQDGEPRTERRRPFKLPRVRHPESYIEPTHLLPPSKWLSVAKWGVLLIAAGGDAANFYLTLAVAAASMSSTLLNMAVAALTVMAVASTHSVGITSRKRAFRAQNPYLGLGVVGLTLVWLSLGGAAFAFRLNAQESAEGNLADAGFSLDGLAPAEPVHDNTQLLLSLMMLALYLSTGALAAWFAYHDYNPYARAMARARKAVERAGQEKALAETWLLRHQEELSIVTNEIEREHPRFLEDVEACHNRAEELKQLVRVYLAEGLADPASTSALLSPAIPAPRRTSDEQDLPETHDENKANA